MLVRRLRTHGVKIGLRKALGATNRSIMLQFFVEGIFAHTGQWTRGMALAGGFMALLGSYNFRAGLIRRGSFFDLRSWPSPSLTLAASRRALPCAQSRAA